MLQRRPQKMEAWQLSTTAFPPAPLPKSPSRSRTALSFILFSLPCFCSAFLLLHKMEALRLFCRVLLLSLTSFLIRLSGLYEWKGIYSLTKENLKRRTLLGWWRLGEKSFLLPVPATLIQGLTTAVSHCLCTTTAS